MRRSRRAIGSGPSACQAPANAINSNSPWKLSTLRAFRDISGSPTPRQVSAKVSPVALQSLSPRSTVVIAPLTRVSRASLHYPPASIGHLTPGSPAKSLAGSRAAPTLDGRFHHVCRAGDEMRVLTALIVSRVDDAGRYWPQATWSSCIYKDLVQSDSLFSEFVHFVCRSACPGLSRCIFISMITSSALAPCLPCSMPTTTVPVCPL